MEERLTSTAWKNFDPWECCGQDDYCKRGCHDEGGCAKGCIVPKIYAKLAKLEDAALSRSEPTTDAEVQRAIELIKERRALVYGALDKNIPDDDRVYLWRNIKSFDLAIRALQQYRTGPCEWCVPEAEFFVASALDSKHVRDTDEPNFCPNCGRQLDLIPSESTQTGAIRQARGDDE